MHGYIVSIYVCCYNIKISPHGLSSQDRVYSPHESSSSHKSSSSHESGSSQVPSFFFFFLVFFLFFVYVLMAVTVISASTITSVKLPFTYSSFKKEAAPSW